MRSVADTTSVSASAGFPTDSAAKARPLAPFLVVAGAALGHHAFSSWPPAPGPDLGASLVTASGTANVAVPLVFAATPSWLLAAWQASVVAVFVHTLRPDSRTRGEVDRVGAAVVAAAVVLALAIIIRPLSAPPTPHWGAGFTDPPSQLEVGGTLTYQGTTWDIEHVEIVELAGFAGVDPALQAGGLVALTPTDR